MVVQHELLRKVAHLTSTGHHAKQYWSAQRPVVVAKTTAQIVQKRITPQAAEAAWGVMSIGIS